ncbi:MAG TPA: hypothetical protein K8V91_01135 [[Clostridium] spiroforme]|uniref:Uncharacterized protein n=1 Tax=Thomasclavelia spiroformis TaxID=29348 RepID=A0A921GA90_9FIRM|nr:hypothetical protein [Thomasclavelia spiroformis]
MSEQILNVNKEMNQMQQYIDTVTHCTWKINEIIESSILYAANKKINIYTIIATVYLLICAIVQYNIILISIGVVLGIIVILTLPSSVVPVCNLSCLMIICMIASSIGFFMFFYNFVPVIVALVQWLITAMSNFKMKNQVWKILTSLNSI